MIAMRTTASPFTAIQDTLRDAVVTTLAAGTPLREEPKRYLFVLSHWRSGSTLLCHILNSHPDIAAAGELHQSYHRQQDLRRLDARLALAYRRLRIGKRYACDKLVDERWEIRGADTLARSNVYFILLLRNARRSLASIHEMRPKWEPERLGQYYLTRLSLLKDYGRLLWGTHRGLFLRYEDLLAHTPEVFRALSHFLEVDDTFSEQYHLTRTTGRVGWGDRWGHIMAGRIVRKPRQLRFTVPEAIAEQCEVAEAACAEELTRALGPAAYS
jgi:hypothetical protein